MAENCHFEEKRKYTKWFKNNPRHTADIRCDTNSLNDTVSPTLGRPVKTARVNGRLLSVALYFSISSVLLNNQK